MPELKLIEVKEEQYPEAVECYVSAFAAEPLFDFFFAGDEETKFRKMRDVFEFSCIYRKMTGEPLLGVELEGELVAVAGLRTPRKVEWTDEIERVWKTTMSALTEADTAAFKQYENLKKSIVPEPPHHYVASLVVKPGHQGKGIGGFLLEKICEIARADPDSTATMLDTTTDLNLKFYKKHSFETIGQGKLGDCPVYFMKRDAV